MKISAKKIAYLGMLLIIALSFGYVERVLPTLTPFAGVRIGLANAVILVALYVWDAKTALVLNVLRVALSGLLFSGVTGALYALCGATTSFAVILITKRSRIFGIVGVSAAGGAFHNLGQLACAAIVTQTPAVMSLLPLLTLLGIASGVIVGIVAGLCINRLPGAVAR